MKREDTAQKRKSAKLIAGTVKRTPAQMRELARALANHPIPELTKKEIGQRWKVGTDTVRKLLRQHHLDPGAEKGLTVPLVELLRCEGDPDPLGSWALGSDEQRANLQADLLTLEEYSRSDRRRTKLHPGTYRRHAREGRSGSIRIGKVYRFRPDFEAAARWSESELGDNDDD